MGNRVARRPAVLFAEDEARNCRWVSAAFEGTFAVMLVEDGCSAIDVLSSDTPLVGGIIDIKLPGASGVEVIREAVRLRPGMPLLGLTCWDVAEAQRELSSWNVVVASKEDGVREIRRFVPKVAAGYFLGTRTCAARFTAWARAQDWSPSEAFIAAAVTSGWARSQVADALGIRPSTFQTHVGRLLRKSDAESLAGLVADLLGAPSANNR